MDDRETKLEALDQILRRINDGAHSWLTDKVKDKMVEYLVEDEEDPTSPLDAEVCAFVARHFDDYAHQHPGKPLPMLYFRKVGGTVVVALERKYDDDFVALFGPQLPADVVAEYPELQRTQVIDEMATIQAFHEADALIRANAEATTTPVDDGISGLYLSEDEEEMNEEEILEATGYDEDLIASASEAGTDDFVESKDKIEVKDAVAQVTTVVQSYDNIFVGSGFETGRDVCMPLL